MAPTRRRSSRRLATALFAATVFAVGCNDVPVKTLCEGFRLQVDQTQENVDIVKLDFLWIVDDSTSMCQEQATLAASIDDFITQLGSFGSVDLRAAVVTTDSTSANRSGLFNSVAASEYPPLCQVRRVFPARSNLHCECGECAGWDEEAPEFQACLDAGGCLVDPEARKWVVAEKPANLQFIRNKNGSLNASCKRTCGGAGVPVAEADEDCQDLFGEDHMICQVPGGDPGAAGCLEPPNTGDCPDDLPPVLPHYDAETGDEIYGLEYFRCIATVGAEQRGAAGLEQGLKVAWQALDPKGANALQICDPNDPVLQDSSLSTAEKRERCTRRFLRDDAILVLVFVSDEDDCSTDEGKHIEVDDHNRCVLLGDRDTPREEIRIRPLAATTSDRPLAPVYVFANRFRGLKRNPADVFVGAIVGDVLTEQRGRTLSAADIQAGRDAYYESLLDPTNPSALNTTVCASILGGAQLGMRYIQLVEMFGTRGFQGNICSNDGFADRLRQMADSLAQLIFNICLPRPPITDETGNAAIRVMKIAPNGEETELVQGQNADFVVGTREECVESGMAVFFRSKDAIPRPTDKVRFIYEAEGSCGL